MPKGDSTLFMKALAASVREAILRVEERVKRWVSDELKLVDQRIASLPTPRDGKDGRDGKDAEIIDITKLGDQVYVRIKGAFDEAMSVQISRAVEEWKQNKPRDGKDADMDAVQKMIAEHVRSAVDAIPKPRDGKDGASVDVAAVERMVQAHVLVAVSELPKPKDGEPGKSGKDGESIHPDTIRLMVIDQVKKAIAEIPKPKDGQDGEPGTPGRDALSLEPADGIDFDKSYVIGQWATHNGGLWRCMDGKQWKCMVDGHHDVDEVHDGERTITITHRWSSGKEKKFVHVTKEMKQRGIWEEGREYTWGDVVTRGGSQWYCQVERTKNQPAEEGNHDWVLIVRRGRDAKIQEEPKPRGPIELR